MRLESALLDAFNYMLQLRFGITGRHVDNHCISPWIKTVSSY
jgi:hypothetical protein